MDQWKFFTFLKIIFGLIVVNSGGMNTRDHVNIIKNVYYFYKSTSMTVIHFTNHHNILQTNVIFDIARMLSDERIMTSTIAFDEMNPLKSYNKIRDWKQNVKPLNVILLTSKKSTIEINDLTKYFPLHESINLILFIEIDESPLTDICMFPVGNPLKFRFDTYILVKCYEDNVIREWQLQSLNRMHFFEWAFLNSKSELIIKTNGSAIGRRSLEGRVLRIATVKDSYFTQWIDGNMTGFFNYVLQELKHAMNFTVVKIRNEKSYGSFHAYKQIWTGALGLAVRGEVDLVVSDFSLTPNRICCIDFTVPLVTLKNCLFIKQPSLKLEIRWYGHFRPFRYEVWGTIILILLTTPILLSYINKKINKSHIKSKLLSDNCLDVWAIFCQQGLSDFPSISSLGIAYFSISILAIIILSVYSASLISSLAMPTINLPFQSLDEFVQDGTYRLIVIRDSSKYDLLHTSNDSTFIKMSKLFLPKYMLPLNLDDGLNMLCRQRVAFYGRETLIEEASSIKIACQLTKIETGQLDTVAMIMPKNSPYTNMINHYVTEMKSNGVLPRIRSKFVKQVPWKKTTTYNSVGFWEIVLLISILGAGISSGLIILFVEQIVFNYLKSRRNKINIRDSETDRDGASIELKKSDECSERRELIIHFLKSSYNPRIVQTPIRTLIENEKN